MTLCFRQKQRMEVDTWKVGEKSNLSLSFIHKYLSDLTIMMTHFSYRYKLCITCPLIYQEINENSISSHHAIKFD